jgi:F-type H+-transporting ATPase subunit gamma
MSGQLRTLRNRIRSVENTKKITRAMEMVAAAKLRRFQDMMNKSRAFTQGLETLLKKVAGAAGAQHPFITPREEKKIAVVVMTSDTGLCGSYNNDLMNLANKFIREQSTRPTLIGVGKAGITTLKNAGIVCLNGFTDIRASRVEEILAELKTVIESLYLSGEVDAIYVVYSHFKTVTQYKAVVEKLLPLERPVGDEKAADAAKDYIFEPSPEVLFQKLIPQFFEAKTRMIFLEAIVSEQIARMTAMNLATKNAKEMIDALVLKRNNARQASITKELIEIVSGSQALKLK